MKQFIRTLFFTGCITGAALAQPVANAPSPKMSFFISSQGSGKGGDLGGIEGADRLCNNLAEAAGVRGKTWHAYLSMPAIDGRPAVDARDRIGRGPWYNANGVEVGRSVADLHRPGSPINKETALTERGDAVKGRGDTPNQHDILTGSTPHGQLASGNSTCNGWRSSGEGTARVGHFDRTGGGDYPTSWISAHSSKSCSLADFRATGGEGRIYCFAAR